MSDLELVVKTPRDIIDSHSNRVIDLPGGEGDGDRTVIAIKLLDNNLCPSKSAALV